VGIGSVLVQKPLVQRSRQKVALLQLSRFVTQSAFSDSHVARRFAHRATAAVLALAFLSAGVILAEAAFPPFDPAVIRNSIRLGGERFVGSDLVLMLQVNRLTVQPCYHCK